VVLEALRTPMFGQRLDVAAQCLVGERHQVLTNDREWEAHVIEGVWVLPYCGKYYMFYAGNDFSTAQYGIGVAVANTPVGPFHKQPTAFLGSTLKWLGPGHASVAVAPDGGHRLFFHAYAPGHAGYKQFRALLASRIRFEGGMPVLVRQRVSAIPLSSLRS
jgi:arabinan endo-1,5-alpha-L-arabinosidase